MLFSIGLYDNSACMHYCMYIDICRCTATLQIHMHSTCRPAELPVRSVTLEVATRFRGSGKFERLMCKFAVPDHSGSL